MTKYVLTSYIDDYDSEEVIGTFDTYDEALDIKSTFETLDALNGYGYGDREYYIESTEASLSREEYIKRFYGSDTIPCLIVSYKNNFDVNELHVFNKDWIDEIGIFDRKVYQDILYRFRYNEELKVITSNLIKYDNSRNNMSMQVVTIDDDTTSYERSLISKKRIDFVKVDFDLDENNMFEAAAKELLKKTRRR